MQRSMPKIAIASRTTRRFDSYSQALSFRPNSDTLTWTLGWRATASMPRRQPNVHVKVSEFGLKDAAWEYESNRRVVLEAIAIFGIERCMFASNFPVASLRIDYDTLVRSLDRMLADRSQTDRDRFFWKNAAAFYRLSLPLPDSA